MMQERKRLKTGDVLKKLYSYRAGKMVICTQDMR